MNLLSALALLFAWLVIVGISWLGWQLIRQNGRLLMRLEQLEKRLDALEFGGDEQPIGLPVGNEAPVFDLPDLAGDRKSLAQYQGQPLLLIFFNPACGFCRELLPRLAALDSSPQDERKTATRPTGPNPLILIVSTGATETNRTLFDEHKVTWPLVLQKEMEVAAAYKANGTPSGYLIDADGKLASELAIGANALLRLAEGKGEPNPKANARNGRERENRFSNHSVARSKIKRDGLKAGTPAPDFHLPRLDGQGHLSLSELRGRQVLLVFSSPDCGPCNTLAPELEKFHRESVRGAASPSPAGQGRGEGESSASLQVIMISKGEPKENRAKVREHGLTFPILLQQQWEISRRYAMFATPIAYLIDEQGVIIHDVAVGLEPILELLARSAANQSLEVVSA
jgi:peroxiredoxin